MKIQKVKPNAITPTYGSEQASGFDLYSTIEITLDPKSRVRVPTGLIFDIPKGFEIQVRSRSGLALNHGVVVLNSPGTIDADFTGEVGIILINHGQQAFKVQEGDRIAQGVLATVCDHVKFKVVDTITKQTERSGGGYGSTGLNNVK